MLDLSHYIKNLISAWPILQSYQYPWQITEQLGSLVEQLLTTLNKDDFKIEGLSAIHKTAVLEDHVTIHDGLIVMPYCRIRAGSYLRGPNILGSHVSIGANCEIKQSMICDQSRIAHLNYIGNSVIGEDVNIEGGAVLANHFNERNNKEVSVVIEGKRFATGINKFGSLLGDGCRIGANAVLSPGTVLLPNSVVGRLTLVNQDEHYKV